MNRTEMMTKLSNYALTLPKGELHTFIFELCKWVPDMNLWSFAEDMLNNKEVKVSANTSYRVTESLVRIHAFCQYPSKDQAIYLIEQEIEERHPEIIKEAK